MVVTGAMNRTPTPRGDTETYSFRNVSELRWGMLSPGEALAAAIARQQPPRSYSGPAVRSRRVDPSQQTSSFAGTAAATCSAIAPHLDSEDVDYARLRLARWKMARGGE